LLRDFQRDIRADLGKLDLPAELEINGQDRLPLAGQEVLTSIEKDSKGLYALIFPIILKNKGLGSTGPIFIKIYTDKAIPLWSPSTDEEKFQYEKYMSSTDLELNELPGQYSQHRVARIPIEGKIQPPSGKHSVLMKVYYGKGKIALAAFNIIVPSSVE
jgi:hypothetical protein